ncbi:MAG TPA: GlxA family transcriptional regulator [Acidiphilium sp.]
MTTKIGLAQIDHQHTEIVVFLVVAGFSMMSLSSAIEPLRSLNRLAGRDAYQWRIASLHGESVAASNGIAFAAMPLAAMLDRASFLFVCGGLRITPQMERAHIAALRRAGRLGIVMGSLSTATYLLARAGLLNGYRCTIHWENRPAFMEEFPDIECTDRLYEIDRERMTCSGGIAAMDLMLHLIAVRHGGQLAQSVANQFHHDRIRDSDDEQRGGWASNLTSLPASLRRVVEAMTENLETPLPIRTLAGIASVSPRQLERIFMRYTGKTPARYYLGLRVARGRELLIYSDWQILEIAVASGFASTSLFSQWFRRFYHMAPSEMRRKTRGNL